MGWDSDLPFGDGPLTPTHPSQGTSCCAGFTMTEEDFGDVSPRLAWSLVLAPTLGTPQVAQCGPAGQCSLAGSGSQAGAATAVCQGLTTLFLHTFALLL